MAVPLAVSMVERAMPHGRGARATSLGQSKDGVDNRSGLPLFSDCQEPGTLTQS